MIDHSQRTFWVATGGVLVPLGSGFALAWLFLPETPLKLPQALLVGFGLSISALPVSVKVLRELDLLHTPVGNTIVSAAVFDDVIGLFLLVVVLSLIETGASLDAIQAFALLGKIALFFVLTVVLGWYGMPRVMKAATAFRVPSPVFSALLVIALGFAFLAELLGMDFILGPFMAGLFFDPKTLGRDAYESVKGTVQATTDGLLAPLFFASIGARVDLSAVSTVPVFLGALLAVAFLGKLLGAGVPARLSGLTTRQSTAVGVGLSGRGAVKLIIASIALEAGLFDHPDPVVPNLFSALVITAVVTTIVMPAGLRLILARAPNGGGAAR